MSMRNDVSIEVTDNLQEYLQGALDKAIKKTGLALHPVAHTYILKVLVEFTDPDKFHGKKLLDLDSNIEDIVKNAGEQALLVLLDKAQDLVPTYQLEVYKHVGNRILYRGSMSPDAFEDSVNSRDYFAWVASNAFHKASTVARNGEVYEYLSDNFGDILDTVARIPGQMRHQKSYPLLSVQLPHIE